MFKRVPPKRAKEVCKPDLSGIMAELNRQQAAKATGTFKPQVQMILTNDHYAAAALDAIQRGSVIMASFNPMGPAAYSFEVMTTPETARTVRQAYADACEAMGLANG